MDNIQTFTQLQLVSEAGMEHGLSHTPYSLSWSPLQEVLVQITISG